MIKKAERSSKALSKNVKHFMSMLPSEDLLGFAENRTQVLYWLGIRENAELLGECLSARFSRRGDNPARQLLLKNKITPQKYELINLKVDAWDLFYELLQMSWDDMRQLNTGGVCNNFPFSCEQDLFSEIFAELYNTWYFQCLKNTRCSLVNIEKAAKILRQSIWQKKGLTSEQLQQVDNLIGQEVNFPLFRYTFEFFLYLAREDRVICKKLEEYRNTWDKLSDWYTREATRQRKSKDCPSYIWKDNQLCIAQQGSKYINIADYLNLD